MNEKSIKEEFLQKINKVILERLRHQKPTPSFDVFKEVIEDKIRHFSWGILFLHLKALGESTVSEAELNLEEAFNFECFGISVELLDDFLDQDNKALNELAKEDLIMLYTEFLIRGIYPFAQIDAHGSGLGKLLQTLKGEWADLNTLLTKTFTENDYFENIVSKSTEFFSFLTQCALGNDPQFEAFETLMKSIAEMTQVLNDIRGLYDPTKNDLIKKSPTLPLIKFVENEPDKNTQLLKDHSDGLISTSELILKIEDSGALDYCHFLLSEYKIFILNHINTHFSMEKLRPLLTYFKLERWYEPI